jgi:hypothetical protein
MAALETTLDARPDVVVSLVREYADRKRWRLVSVADPYADQGRWGLVSTPDHVTEFVFRRFGGIFSYRHKVYVTIRRENSAHSVVTVESEGLNLLGFRALFDWLDFGEGKRLVLGLLDFLTERTDTQV